MMSLVSFLQAAAKAADPVQPSPVRNFTDVVQALTPLAWPIIVFGVFLFFRPAISALIESAKSRKFSFKIGGQELSMEEANQVQQKLIADLQTQVADIQKRLADTQPAEPRTITSAHEGMASPPKTAPALRHVEAAAAVEKLSSVLWVDDNPKNNSYFIQQLTDLGVQVDLAKSTDDGEDFLARKKYDLIISDMARREGIKTNSIAGLDILKIAKEQQPETPVVIYCSARAVRMNGGKALQLGAKAITSSPTELTGILNLSAQSQ